MSESVQNLPQSLGDEPVTTQPPSSNGIFYVPDANYTPPTLTVIAVQPQPREKPANFTLYDGCCCSENLKLGTLSELLPFCCCFPLSCCGQCQPDAKGTYGVLEACLWRYDGTCANCCVNCSFCWGKYAAAISVGLCLVGLAVFAGEGGGKLDCNCSGDCCPGGGCMPDCCCGGTTGGNTVGFCCFCSGDFCRDCCNGSNRSQTMPQAIPANGGTTYPTAKTKMKEKPAMQDEVTWSRTTPQAVPANRGTTVVIMTD